VAHSLAHKNVLNEQLKQWMQGMQCDIPLPSFEENVGAELSTLPCSVITMRPESVARNRTAHSPSVAKRTARELEDEVVASVFQLLLKYYFLPQVAKSFESMTTNL